MGIYGTENLSNNIMQDQKRFHAKEVLRNSRERHVFLLTDRVTQFVKGESSYVNGLLDGNYPACV